MKEIEADFLSQRRKVKTAFSFTADFSVFSV